MEKLTKENALKKAHLLNVAFDKENNKDDIVYSAMNLYLKDATKEIIQYCERIYNGERVDKTHLAAVIKNIKNEIS